MTSTNEKFETLRSMNTIIKNMNDESAYDAWIYIIPDGADDDESFKNSRNGTLTIFYQYN